jgi:hypothetical protein
MSYQKYQKCIEACVACAEACEYCATRCLGEENIKKMVECIRLDRDCAEICWLTAAFMRRDSEYARELCLLSADICDECSAECGKHAMDHCQSCADECSRCADHCRGMVHARV